MKTLVTITGWLSLGLAACTTNPSDLSMNQNMNQLKGQGSELGVNSDKNPSTNTASLSVLQDNSVPDARMDKMSTTRVVSNMVYALGQLEELQPIQTTLQIKIPETSIGRTVMAELKDAGYGLQLVDSDIGPNYVRYKFEESTTESGLVTRFSMSIGEIEGVRDYVIEDHMFYPDSALNISGAKEVFVELNDELFEEKGANYRTDVVFTDSTLPEYLGPFLNEETAGVNASTANSSGSDALITVIKKNIHDTGTSNYARLFEAYGDVESTILVFSNDSMVLGEKNKRIVADFVHKMNPDTDLVSIIGCSHGRTDITNGNSVLAVGRANRVKEAFVYAGVDYGKVLDEGCWAPTHFDEVMPRRGVVLTLKRLKEAARSG